MHDVTPRPPALPRGHAIRFAQWARLALLIVGVMAIHLWVLMGTPRWLPQWQATPEKAEPQVISLSTRTLPVPTPALTPAPLPKPGKPKKTNKPRNMTAAEAPATPPASAAGENSEPIVPPAPEEPAQAAIEDVAKPASVEPAPEPKPHSYRYPAPVQLHYDVDALTDGNHNVATAELTWQHDGSNYQASLIARKFQVVKLRQLKSAGALGADGLAPLRFAEKPFSGSEVAAHFVREQSQVVFSANTPTVDLLPGAQDQLSVFLQLASMLNGEPDRIAPGEHITFQTMGGRYAENWTFLMDSKESIALPGATLDAYKLTRESEGQYGIKAEVWLAPAMNYLPVRIRLSQTNGNVLDMVWIRSQTP